MAYDGLVENGRPLELSGAHCKGHNRNSIGICLVGKDEFTPEQLDSLLDQLEFICKTYDIPYSDIYGHCEFSEKTCPNFDVGSIRDIMKARLG
jgi:N-acetyl-anhydromuramyl-L-alanine amidase AmpD